MRKLKDTYNKWGLKINFKKTKYILTGGNGQDLVIKGEIIRACRDLEMIISEESNCQKEITNRIIKQKKLLNDGITCFSSKIYKKKNI